MINKAHRWSLSALASALKHWHWCNLFSGCSELGLLSNDKVTDADNDQVVFVGDSICPVWRNQNSWKQGR